MNKFLEIVNRIKRPFFEITAVCLKKENRYLLYTLQVKFQDDKNNNDLFLDYDSILFYRMSLATLEFNSFFFEIINKNWKINNNEISFEIMTESFALKFLPRRIAKSNYKIDNSFFYYIQTGKTSQEISSLMSKAEKDLLLQEIPYSSISDACNNLLNIDGGRSISPYIRFLAPLNVKFGKIDNEENVITVTFQIDKLADLNNYKINIYGVDEYGSITKFRFSKRLSSISNSNQIKIAKNINAKLHDSQYDVIFNDDKGSSLKFELYYDFDDLYLSEDFFEKIDTSLQIPKSIDVDNLEYSYQNLGEINCELFERVISKEESQTLEFKSSMLSKENDERGDDYLVDNIIKGMASFLNTEGGILIIGVNPEKDVIGIEKDYNHLRKEKNFDEWQRFLTDKISSRLKDATVFLSISIFEKSKQNHDIVIIFLRKHQKPVTFYGEKQEFIIRSNNLRKILTVAETIDFVRTHWPSRDS